MNPDELAHIRAMIDRAFRDELRGQADEMNCVRRNDHQGAADAHKARRRALERAGALIERLP